MTERRRLVLTVARLFLFVKELPLASNAGRWIEAMQRIGGTIKGQPWCACFVSLVLGIAFGGKPPLPFTASCDVLLEAARAKGWLRDTPTPGCVFLRMKTDTDAEHTGFASEEVAAKWGSIEGNANAAGGREGVQVCELQRPIGKERYLFIDYPDEVAA